MLRIKIAQTGTIPYPDETWYGHGSVDFRKSAGCELDCIIPDNMFGELTIATRKFVTDWLAEHGIKPQESIDL